MGLEHHPGDYWEEMAAFDEVDLELIGALMDGRLTGAERERAIKLLGESEAAFEVYTEALRARADLEEVEVVPIPQARPRPRARSWRVAVPYAAAALLMIAIFPSIRALRNRGTDDGSAVGTAGPVMADSPVTAIARPLLSVGTDLPKVLGARWDERHWTVYRGGGVALVDSATAFRLGVRATDLRIALAADERERAGRLSNEMLQLLKPVDLAESVRSSYTDVQAGLASRRSLADVTEHAVLAENDLADFLDSRWFVLGKWFAAGEVAARARKASFFAAPNTARFLDWAIQSAGLAPSDVALLRQVKGLTGRGLGGDDFDTIRQNFAELIRRHGD